MPLSSPIPQFRFSTAPSFHPINLIPLLNIICLTFLLLFCATFLVLPASINTHLPKTLTSDIVPDNILTISITSEDIIFFRDKVMTTKDLRGILKNARAQDQAVLIRADGRSSLARVIDLLNLCRELDIQRVNITTTKMH